MLRNFRENMHSINWNKNKILPHLHGYSYRNAMMRRRIRVQRVKKRKFTPQYGKWKNERFIILYMYIFKIILQRGTIKLLGKAAQIRLCNFLSPPPGWKSDEFPLGDFCGPPLFPGLWADQGGGDFYSMYWKKKSCSLLCSIFAYNTVYGSWTTRQH